MKVLLLLPLPVLSAGPTLRIMPAPSAQAIPILPGVDAVGIGFDAVKGSSTGVARQVVDFSFSDGKTYEDPFGDNTVYAYPDQAKVQRVTTQQTEHKIFRSVSQYVSKQAADANLDASVGPWFSASVNTQAAWSTMKSGTHIIAESSSQVGVFIMQLDPGSLLSPHSKMSAFLATLPDKYDRDAYQKFIAAYGTHFVSSGTFGGRATMKTTIAQEYYSRQSDFSIQAQLQVSWNQFGGGAGGGGSSTTHDSTWSENTDATTYTSGGDPAIKSFDNSEEWKRWVESVETNLPVMTSYTLEPIHLLAGTKQKYVQQAVAEYALSNDVTFPEADLTQLQMDWCDCYEEQMSGQDSAHGNAVLAKCKKTGFLVVGMAVAPISGHVGYEMIPNDFDGYNPLYCCRPCFTASN